ncbi:MAG: PKD domain-containing protein, partial [Lentisphaeria bacterium]|nr:PKD domain-containing protein [Lentisphaeria bacterium]
RYEAGGRAGGTSYGSARRSGNYLVAQTNGVMNAVQGTHCLVHYDPAVAHQLGGGALAAPDFAVVVADAFDLVYAAYRDAGYDVPNYVRSNVDLFLTAVELDRRADIYLSDTDNTYKEAFYSWKTKNYYLPTSFASADDAKFTLAHELFHAIQNRIFTGPAMAANRWLFEMTAEYASRKAPWNETLSNAYLVELSAALGSVDEIHEYACAHLLLYLLGKTGGNFKSLWDTTLATSFTPHAALNTYAKNLASLSLNRLYAHFLEDILFDSDLADLAMPVSPTDWEGGNVVDKNLAIPAAEAAGWMKTRMPAFGSYPARVLIDLPDGVPDRVNARIYKAPYNDPKTAGGREPLDSFFTGETLPFVSTSLAATDSIYVLGYNYFGSAKSMRVWIRPLVLTMTQTPPAVVANTPCTFEAMVAPIPDCVQQLKAYWKPSDGSAWQVDTLSAQTQEFTYIHTFQTEADKTFQVTFELYGLDAEGRRQLIVSQTRNVPVDGRPSIQLVPSVARAEINQTVAFAAQVSNGPDHPVYRWTFGDGSPTVETTDPDADHVYTVAKTYTVTVGLADAAAPTVVLVQCTGQAVIEEPAHVVDPPPSPPPQAPGLDYSTLRRVDETRWWDGVRELYYLDAAGRRHGLYQAFLQSGSTSKPLEAGMYIHGRREGQWLAYQQDGTGAIDRWEYQWDLAYGLNGQARQFSTLARFGGGGSPVHVYFDDSGVTHMNWPMAEILGQACVLHYMDGTYETVSFDAQGRRHGACTVHNSADRLLGQGTFTAGVKTGVWSYYEWSGGVATGVSYNHDKDPPNHK